METQDCSKIDLAEAGKDSQGRLVAMKSVTCDEAVGTEPAEQHASIQTHGSWQVPLTSGGLYKCYCLHKSHGVVHAQVARLLRGGGCASALGSGKGGNGRSSMQKDGLPGHRSAAA